MLNNEPRMVEKQIYSLVVETEVTRFLDIQAAYSLEEAFYLAKMEYDRRVHNGVTSSDLDGAKIHLFTIKTFNELARPNEEEVHTVVKQFNLGRVGKTTLKKVFDTIEGLAKLSEAPELEIEPNPAGRKPSLVRQLLSPEEEKNALMQQIIKDKDVKKCEALKKSFTPAEYKYLKEHLRGNVNKNQLDK